MTAVIDGAPPRAESLFKHDLELPEKGASSTRKVFDDQIGEFMEVPGYRMERLRPGDEINGPAIIDAMDTTVFVLEDQRSFLDERKCLHIK